MSGRRTSSKVLLGSLLAVLLSACQGSGSGSGTSSTAIDSPDGLAILKVSYFRALPEPRTKKH